MPLPVLLKKEIGKFFAEPAGVTVASAPGRADVMGGVSDYAGGLVLEGTIAERAYVAVAPRRDSQVRLRTVGAQAQGSREVSWSLQDCLPSGPGGTPPLRRKLSEQPDQQWSAYLAGVLTSLLHHQPALQQRSGGWDILLESHVPSGAGVSSSAAIEVAALRSITQSLNLQIDGLSAARICQWAENHVAGAPCGIMDQVTTALGKEGELLALLCQPCTLRGFQRLPQNLTISCLNTNVKHSVGGSHYSSARIGAFMGLEILRQAGARPSITGSSPLAASDSDCTADLGKDDGKLALEYLCQLDALEYHSRWASRLPLRITGAEFMEQYGRYPDTATVVDPKRSYRVRSCTSHPIHERRRVQTFLSALQRAELGDDQASLRAGRQMYASDWSYTHRIGLGCREASILVQLVRALGPQNGFFGARITGGGAGGSVAVLHLPESAPLIRGIVGEYGRQTGIHAGILTGSSPGAWETFDVQTGA